MKDYRKIRDDLSTTFADAACIERELASFYLQEQQEMP